MRGPAITTLLIVALGITVSEVPGQHQASGSPFQADYPFTVGSRLELRVEVEGVQVDWLEVTPLEEISPAREVQCSVVVSGSNVGDRRAEIEVVLILESDAQRALERITMAPFRVRSGRDFEETQRFRVTGSKLRQARRVFVDVEVK